MMRKCYKCVRYKQAHRDFCQLCENGDIEGYRLKKTYGNKGKDKAE